MHLRAVGSCTLHLNASPRQSEQCHDGFVNFGSVKDTTTGENDERFIPQFCLLAGSNPLRIADR
jgi:hypothetical protein